MIEKLEDYLLPTNLRQDSDTETDVDDGGISDKPLTLEEIMEFESSVRNYPNAVIDNLVISDDEEHYVDHEHLEEREELLSEIMQEDENSGLYQKSIPEYLLNDSEIVGFPDEEMQEEIYKWVEEDLPKHHFSIKDLGAGRCDFYGRLRHREGYHDERTGVDYFGIESNPNLCEVARQKYPGVKVINNKFQDVSIQTDFTICIGTLNDDHGEDKWEYFNNTLTGCLSDTKTAVIFVLAADFEGKYGYLDYPIHELVQRLDKNLRWEIDYSLYEDIYKLTVHIGGYN